MSEAEATIERLFPWGCAALAPMVRCGTLPLRLQSLRYGADAVYGEEVIALKMPKVQRVFDGVPPLTSPGAIRVVATRQCVGAVMWHPLTAPLPVPPERSGVISYVIKGSSAFSTCAEERGRVVFQLGAPDAVSALRAAEVVCVPQRPFPSLFPSHSGSTAYLRPRAARRTWPASTSTWAVPCAPSPPRATGGPLPLTAARAEEFFAAGRHGRGADAQARGGS